MKLHEHIHSESVKACIESFESSFAEYVDRLAGIVITSGPELAKPVVQALVNAYHDRGEGVGPVEIPNFNTLTMFVKITGATLERSSENENLNILKPTRPSA